MKVSEALAGQMTRPKSVASISDSETQIHSAVPFPEQFNMLKRVLAVCP